ncbi:recombination associated protein [Pectobacterium betavasculorum]|uniref:Recombination-associated protein RdgC n=1 Tax=Pectobacterium betavasculorum TaxID=55207 RepID=A0A093RWP1_9GAMM|nr:recombination associated protein [Pectobacterium betavasculorum]
MSMTFKNALIYRLNSDVMFDDLEKKLAPFAFTPCGSQDRAKTGWISPICPLLDVLSHQANGQIMLTLQREEKILPAPVIARELAAKIDSMETVQRRRLKKTEKDALKDEVIQTLLPRAFSKYHTTKIWINAGAGLIIVDAASGKKAEDALALLRKTLGSLPVVPLTLETPIELTLTEWVRNGKAPADFALQEEAELKAVLEEGGILRSKHQDLTSDEITNHIDAGKLVTKLALEWRERISFVLADDGSLKKLKFSDSLLEQNDGIEREDEVARFDADFVLLTGELSALIRELVAALGGEVKRVAPQPENYDLQDDKLYPDAVQFVQTSGRATISGLQRHFRIGYNRAAHLIEAMERKGVVSAPMHDGSRAVIGEVVQ